MYFWKTSYLWFKKVIHYNSLKGRKNESFREIKWMRVGQISRNYNSLYAPGDQEIKKIEQNLLIN